MRSDAQNVAGIFAQIVNIVVAKENARVSGDSINGRLLERRTREISVTPRKMK